MLGGTRREGVWDQAREVAAIAGQEESILGHLVTGARFPRPEMVEAGPDLEESGYLLRHVGRQE
jgi:hypothetical protein